MSSKVKIFQIYYTEDQYSKLTEGFVPHFNDKHSIYFESGVTYDLVKQGECAGHDWFGVVSWKFPKVAYYRVRNKKHLISYEGISKRCENTKAQVIGFRNFSKGRILDMTNSDRQLRPVYDKLIDRLDIDPRHVYGKRKNIFWNYFLMRTEHYENYVNSMMSEVIKLFETDEEINQLGNANSRYDRKFAHRGALPLSKEFERETGYDYYPLFPFVLERLINVYVSVHKLKVEWVL